MKRIGCERLPVSWIFVGCVALVVVQIAGQAPPSNQPVSITVVDETGLAVPDAQITATFLGPVAFANVRATTDYAGQASLVPPNSAGYAVFVNKPGFYQAQVTGVNPVLRQVRIVLTHEQMIVEQVSVTASAPGIDAQQPSDKLTLNVPEIINVPYPTSRDIRNLLRFYPGVVQDASGQVHVDGSETWSTLDTLDGFDIRSPVSGNLAMRFSADAVRSIDEQSTRYPVEFGRGTGGVFAFYTGMGDNKFRFNATNFIPSFQNINGIRFDKFVPRITFSGPLARNRAWFFDGLELEYDNIYIRELPASADTDELIRGSDLAKFQVNLAPANILSGGLLFNEYHSPYEGISSLTPQQSTTKRNTIAWLPYVRDQWGFADGSLLDLGLGMTRFTDGYEPHGNAPYQVTPELPQGSYFEALTSHSERIESNAALYLPPLHWLGRHDLKAGTDLDHLGYDESVRRAAISYLRENRALLRQSVFPPIAPFTRHNDEVGAYLQDRWAARAGWLVEPGLRFDWDQIIRRPLWAPRLAVVYSPQKNEASTKISGGIGLYYEHTQLEYFTRALAGVRQDTYYAADGVTPSSPPQVTTFSAPYGPLKQARALNWSVGVEQRLPWSIYLGANLIRKRVSDEFNFVDQETSTGLSGNYVLTNSRTDHDSLFEVQARRTFAGNYTLFGAYTHATARTSAAIEYYPTLTMLGPQLSGPLPWDTPNRVLSWGWLPFLVPWFKKSWDLVYSLDWHTGFPYTAVNANQQVIGAAGAYRFPHTFNLSPGLEWRFHFGPAYFGLRGVIENITGSGNYAVVNNDIDSRQFGTFTEPEGRGLTARIRLIGAK